MKTKVLVVEDDSDYRELIHFFLQLKGFQVLIAGNGQEAVEIAGKAQPDVILMDVNLPVLDGFQATLQIKSEPSTANIPVIVISVYCRDLETKQKLLKAGAEKCLDKPVDVESLPGLIAEHAPA